MGRGDASSARRSTGLGGSSPSPAGGGAAGRGRQGPGQRPRVPTATADGISFPVRGRGPQAVGSGIVGSGFHLTGVQSGASERRTSWWSLALGRRGPFASREVCPGLLWVGGYYLHREREIREVTTEGLGFVRSSALVAGGRADRWPLYHFLDSSTCLPAAAGDANLVHSWYRLLA